MADERLRLTAEVQDRFSGPLRAMRQGLQALSGDVARGLKLSFEDTQRAATALGNQIRGTLTPALGALGVTSLSVAGGLAAITTALRGFSSSTSAIANLAQDVGLSVNQLRQLEAVASRFGAQDGTVQRGVEQFAQRMRDLRRGVGEVNGAFAGLQNGDQWYRALRGARDNNEALQRALTLLSRIPDAQERVRVANALGLDGWQALVRQGLGPLKEALQDAERDTGNLTKEQVRLARQSEEAWQRFRTSLIGLRDVIGAEIAGPMTKAMAVVREWIIANRGEIASGIRQGVEALARFDWRGLAESLREVAQAVMTIARGVNSIQTGRNAGTARLRNLVPGSENLSDEQLLQRSRDYLEQLARQREATGQELEDSQRPSRDFGRSWSREEVERLQETLRRLDGHIDLLGRVMELYRQQLQQGGGVQQQSFQPGGGGGARVWNASTGGGGGGWRIGGVGFGQGGPGGGGFDVEPGGGGGAAPGGGGFRTMPRIGRGVLPQAPGDTPLGRGQRRARAAAGDRDFSPVGGTSQNPILNDVARAEGTTRDGYNASFAHQLRGQDLTGRTLAEIQQIQRRMRGSSAIGRYQFMRATLFGSRGRPGLVQELGLSMDQRFTPEVQERMAHALLVRRGYDRWLRGEMSDEQFAHNLSAEWAGLTNPRTGRGYYRGQTTGYPVARTYAAMQAERARIAAGGQPGAGPTAQRDWNVDDGPAHAAARRRAQDAGLPDPWATQRGAAPPPDWGSEAFGGRQTALTGSATLAIRFEGAPRGMRTDVDFGGMFREVSVDRGHTMPELT